VYTWDITYMARTIRGLFFYAYVIKDIFDKSIVGWSIHAEESERHSRALFERVLKGRRIQLKALHADNGHPMKGVSLMGLLQDLNVAVSHSRPRTSNDNPYIESLFKTMKYHVTYPRAFDTLADARQWMADFVHWYNTEHLHSSIGYVTPHQMRYGQADAIFEQRNDAINRARELQGSAALTRLGVGLATDCANFCELVVWGGNGGGLLFDYRAGAGIFHICSGCCMLLVTDLLPPDSCKPCYIPDYERDYSCWRFGYAAVPGDACGVEAVAADL
ncbi:DDE domain-containing protein, partial [Prosthecochloris sp. ZM_2]|uniref:integrase core domain-containing protein n=1 Tax=Prosthecochloris sp. ZM_2 TaxID=2045206 RepID=UPI000F084EDF